MNCEKCKICDDVVTDDQGFNLSLKGWKGLVKASERRCDQKFTGVEMQNYPLHSSCRQRYTRDTSIACSEKAKLDNKRKRPFVPSDIQLNSTFDFLNKCFYCDEKCGDEVEAKKSKNKRREWFSVKCTSFKQSLIDTAKIRDDDWGMDVLNRICSVPCIVKEGGRYHKECYVNLKTNLPTENKKGRPLPLGFPAQFAALCEFIEDNDSDECQFSLNELQEKMELSCDPRTLKNKLKDKYGDKLLMTEFKNDKTFLCFREKAYNMIRDTWYGERKKDVGEERIRFVEAAGSIIRDDIRSKAYDTTIYDMENFKDNIKLAVPRSLSTLLSSITMKNRRGDISKLEKKNESIAHAIIKATRERSFLSNLQIGVGVFLHRKLGSRLVVDVLAKLGLCASYDEVLLFEASAVMSQKPLTIGKNAFAQYVFDNADHNVRTLDGFNTFHSMGGIVCVTPANKFEVNHQIPRLKTVPSESVLAEVNKIPILTYEYSDISGLQEISIEDIDKNYSQSTGQPLEISTPNFLWFSAKWLGIDVPSWSGFMHQICQHMSYEKSKVVCLPFVNLPPSNFQTIYTVITFAAAQSKKLNLPKCFLTFDHPLYIKGRSIIAEKKDKEPLLKDVVVRLGGFHLLMSFMGSIGYIMNGSGLKELWSTVYATGSIEHMMCGHAFARALRAHMLTHLALSKILLDLMDIGEEEKNKIRQILIDFETNPPTMQDLLVNKDLEAMTKKLNDKLENVKKLGPTAQLWVGYLNMVTLLKQYIQAERLGDWNLHLACVRQMIPIFHAAGHLPYAKAAYLYLQDMLKLEDELPLSLYKQYTMQGFFTIRRSDKAFAGIWTDMTIEQTLMRAMKTSGGFTRGRGVNAGTLSKWILTMPVTHDICENVENYAGVKSKTSEQHSDLQSSSKKRDSLDLNKFSLWFEKHEPFKQNNAIMSIYSGLVGGDYINCHKFMEIGLHSMQEMIGQNFEGIKLKRNNRVLPLAVENSAIKCHDTIVPVSATLLFNRVISLVKTDEELWNLFQYELAPRPLSMFDEFGMRNGKNSTLYSLFKPSACTIDQLNSTFVIDGESLIARVMWPLAGTCTYQVICKLYSDYVVKHFNENAIVVMKGSTSNSNTIFADRTCKKSGANSNDINFKEDMKLTTTRANFLANDKNKKRFMELLSRKLSDSGITVMESSDESAHFIVTTAIHEAITNPASNVCVVGENEELLLILVSIAPAGININFVKLDRQKKAKNVVYSSQQLQGDHHTIKDYLLVLHAISGSKSKTSSFYGKGKIEAFKILRKHKELRGTIDVFNCTTSDAEDIAMAGEKFLLKLYSAPKNVVTLDQLRYEINKRNSKKIYTEIQLSKLPPTSSAARQHSLRSYYLIQKWKGNNIPPGNWGWQPGQGGLIPIKTLAAPAPDELLKRLFCNCSGECLKKCGCRRTGLKCSVLCGTCIGTCSNSIPIPVDFEDDLNEFLEEVED